MTVYLHDTREEWLNAYLSGARPIFEAINAPLPDNIRAAVGFTSKGNKGNVIAEVWDHVASADGHFEIFVKPTITDVARICDAFTHELVHVAAGLKAAHGPAFKRIALGVGLTGRKMSHTVAGPDFYTWALPLIESLGPMPYGALSGTDNTGRKKQKTSLLKVECTACAFLGRVTLKHLAPHPTLNCPVPECDGVWLCEQLDGGEGDTDEG